MSTASTSSPTNTNESPEAVFKAVAYWMGIVGRVNIVLGTFIVVPQLFVFMFNWRTGAASAVFGLLMLLIGVFTLKSAEAFHKVAMLDEESPTHLQRASVCLRNLFRVHALFIVVQAVAMLAVGVVAFTG